MDSERTLASRLGYTTHVSPLRFKLRRLRERYPCPDAARLEDWLVELANHRGASVVNRPEPHAILGQAPSLAELSNEELVVAICLLSNQDEPQLLRLAGQLISRGAVDVDRLCLRAEQERVEPVLGALAIQAVRVEPHHELWRPLADRFGTAAPRHQPVLHWTRLAEPVMKDGRCNAVAWKLVA